MLWFIALWVCENCFNCGYVGENQLLKTKQLLKKIKIKKSGGGGGGEEGVQDWTSCSRRT